MTDHIQEWKDQRDKTNFKETVSKASKIKKKELSIIADNLHDEAFSKIDCLNCANCCKSIPPLINQEDVKRISQFLKIPVSDLYKNHVTIDEDGDMVLNTTPCIFLLPDNKCKVYEVRPHGCREYPLTEGDLFISNMDQHEINAKYCPAVFYVLKQLEDL
ncbi:MAG: zinc/iron-chelating domain-containing protein [Bacteroidetes bacterium]|nr:zinc/iron-chelating domain-containing protein [Bacteroidota bacterium]|tara:strand:- start:98 stop:577 length:480 start_codon:yes stop_codon:yes gene_type:complete